MKNVTRINTKQNKPASFGASLSEVLKTKQPEVYRKLVSTYAVSTRGHK